FPDPETQYGLQRRLNETSGLYNRAFSQSIFDRPLYSFDLRSTYFLPGKLGGDHSLKFGFEWRSAPAYSFGHVGGYATARYATRTIDGVAREVPISADIHRDNMSQAEYRTQALYVQDTYTKDRATVQLGVRFDRQHEWLEAAAVE